jgi:hypothetical protein
MLQKIPQEMYRVNGCNLLELRRVEVCHTLTTGKSRKDVRHRYAVDALCPTRCAIVVSAQAPLVYTLEWVYAL